ncbi:esterase [Streptomyces albus]|uniref:Esterase n=1 Tax=Streptomyces albus (strain ATCC 21838 / DSM 41398 / FERM P-419 / JCM 4703 / NBRC 107858) TaxID=1081613 RepID=A0A0B5F8R4_STRA4|nr:esterase [Streptomyces albus]AOU81569.1 esterase [Streptomyces albus]AYN37262.1 carboxylesterase [Streptomyces albus]
MSDHLPLLPGAEPFSHRGGRIGALILHGFTGSPQGLRPQAEAFAAAGYTVEMPLLPGHGTTVEDMAKYGWADWTKAVDAAYRDLAARCDSVVVLGLSMGGALTLWLAWEHPEIAGIVLVNPFVEPDDFTEMARTATDLLAEGSEFLPGVGNDIADPEATELAYTSTPVRCLLSLIGGMRAHKKRLPGTLVPTLLLHSVQDHIIPPGSSALLTERLGGPVELVELTRGFHVATIDLDKQEINERALEFAARRTSGN